MKPLAISGGQLREVDGGLVMPYAVSGALTAGVGAARWYPRRDITILGVHPAVGIAPTGAAILLDLNIDGTTAFTTQANRPTIAISGFTGSLAVPDVVDVDVGSYITVDVDQIGSTVAGSHLTAQVLYVWRA